MSASPPASSRLARLHQRLQQWADAGWANSVVLGWGLLQGFIFPGLADLFFLPLALARPARAYVLALVATAGTMIGSVGLYWLGHEALDVLQGPLSRFFDLSPVTIDKYRGTLAEWGGWAIFASTMSPLSTKLTSIASGIVGVPFWEFFVALAAGRLTRTMVFAWMARHGGAAMVAKYTGSASSVATVRGDGT